MKKFLLLAASVFCLTLFMSVDSQAGLIGDEVDYFIAPLDDQFDVVLLPGVPLEGSFTIGDGVDATFTNPPPNGLISVDFGEDTLDITIDFFQGTTDSTFMTQFMFYNLDWVGDPGTIVDVVQTGGNDAEMIIFNNNTTNYGTFLAVITPREISTGDLGSVTYSFAIEAEHEVNPVPEPGTYALVGIGMGMMGIAYRRKNRKS